MQDNDNHNSNAPVPEGVAPGIPMPGFGQMIEALGSRRALLGTMFGAMAGGLPFALARSAQAAPPEVKGSPNIPIRIYSNTKGTYVLFADGAITNAEKSEQFLDTTQFAEVKRFQKRSQTANRAKGSPNVAVDIHQDETGTYVLFADGTFRQPPGNAGARGAYVEYFYAKTKDGNIYNPSPNLIIESGTKIRFQNPFREPPFTWATFAITGSDGRSNMYVIIPKTPGHIDATTTGWDISRFNGNPSDGGFFGIGLH
ncbi:MAG: hypothetical protein KF760_30750 [Candidatus Eremiobacteraeota bacterium]|nr:hypothetical protein [Candidatus Eremiobacteraeota bacterium]MCW5868627.1 hypothetical protein [Candidatus Eremiobacteraeota bacterium]